MSRKKRNPSGEWWIDEHGRSTFCDIDVCDIGHEYVAFRHSINLDDDFLDKHIRWIMPGEPIDWGELGRIYSQENGLKCPNDHDAILLGSSWLEILGANMNFINYVELGNDVRKWVMKEEGWVRVSGNNFQMWKFDQPTLERIRNSDLWDNEVSTDDGGEIEESNALIQIEEIGNGVFVYEMTLKDLFDPLITAELHKLRRTDKERMMLDAPKTMVWPKHTTDTAGEKSWLYRRRGDNPMRRGSNISGDAERDPAKWPKPVFKEFKRAYNAAVAKKQESFEFAGQAVLVSYAKYVIQYVEGQGKGRNPRRRRNVGKREGIFYSVEFTNQYLLGEKGDLVRPSGTAQYFETTDASNRFAAEASFNHWKKFNRKVFWRILAWDVDKPDFPDVITDFVDEDTAKYWLKQQMDLYPELFGKPLPPKEL